MNRLTAYWRTMLAIAILGIAATGFLVSIHESVPAAVLGFSSGVLLASAIEGLIRERERS